MNPEFEEALEKKVSMGAHSVDNSLLELNRTAKRMEFSKKLIIFFIVLDTFVVLFTCAAVLLTMDTSPLMYLIPAVAAEVASATAFYYNKSKLENKIKLMRAYNVMPNNQDFNDI